MVELQAMLEKQLTPERALRAAVALVIYNGMIASWNASPEIAKAAFRHADDFLELALTP